MNVRLKYSTILQAGVYFNNKLSMNNYRVVLYMTTISMSNLDQNTAIERIKYFLHSLDSTIFINGADQEQCRKLADAGLNFTNLPEEPVDQVIGIMLYLKLNAIMEDRIVISEIEVDSELGDNIGYLHHVEEPVGPLEEPGWWHDSTTTHCDYTLLDDDNILAMNNSIPWRDLDLSWEDGETEISGNGKVVFADFGKDDTK